MQKTRALWGLASILNMIALLAEQRRLRRPLKEFAEARAAPRVALLQPVQEFMAERFISVRIREKRLSRRLLEFNQ